MGLVSFHVGTQSSYEGITEKDSDALYFLTDTLQIFKGEEEYTKSCEIVTGLPESGQRQGIIYADLSDFSLWTYNGTDYVQINKGYATSISDPGNHDEVPTTKAVVDYVTNKIADVTGGVGVFVTDVSYSDGVLSVAKGDDPVTQTMTGLVNNPSYEAETRTITLPVYGGDSLVIELGKDLVVKEGYYDADSNSIVLVLSNDETVTIPCGSLVDIYTGLATSTAEVTVNEDNTIAVDVKVSATADNSITIEEDGLYLSLADYYTKEDTDAAIAIVSADLQEHVEDEDIHVTAEEKAAWDAKASQEDLDATKEEIYEALEWKTIA